MKEQIETAFPKCKTNKCIEIYNNPKFWISDPEGKTKCVVDLKKEIHVDFEVINEAEKTINFLAIDQCILDDSDDKKCDFALFDDSTFCFIEVKNAKPRTRKDHRKNALKQLANTINLFQKKLDLSSYQLEANVCFSSSIKIFPQRSSQSFAAIKRFQDKFQARLTEGNQKIFL